MPNGKITFIAPVYQYVPVIHTSLIAQRYRDWELLLVHDGPCNFRLKKIIEAYEEPRIKYIETSERRGNWGHSYRRDFLAGVPIAGVTLDPSTEFIVITNGDNYHAPSYCDFMMTTFNNNPNFVGVFCQQMVHNYFNWGILNIGLQLGSIDVACLMVRKEVACETGWEDQSHSSDWSTYMSKMIEKYGPSRFGCSGGALVVHN